MTWYIWFALGMFVGSFLGVIPLIVYDVQRMNIRLADWLKPKISEADRQDLIALAKGLERSSDDPMYSEEVESIRKAILEIADGKPVTARKLEDTLQSGAQFGGACPYCGTDDVFEDDDVDGLDRCNGCGKYWFKKER